jgi:prolipoprotein diacylglyceryltransferase
MKTSQVIFNAIGLFIACMALVSIISILFVVMPGYPEQKRSWWHFLSVYEGVLIITIGGGALGNLAKGRLSGWPTGLMVAGYFMSVWLIPLGIWGIIVLRAEQKRKQTVATKIGVPLDTQ